VIRRAFARICQGIVMLIGMAVIIRRKVRSRQHTE